jgi:hypothetical protein
LCLLTVILLVSLGVGPVNGIPTFYGGGLDNPETWDRILYLNATMFVSSGDFQHYPWEAEHIMMLADSGVRVNFRVDWWARFWNGERATNTSVVDFYYNRSRLGLLEEELDWVFGFLDMDKIWAVTLSEEGPGASYRYFRTPRQLRKYNESFHGETGFYLRLPGRMNRTEEMALETWLAEKNVWVFNHLYDYVKTRWPHLVVFQFIYLYPGAPSVWVGGCSLDELKADAYAGDLYFYDVYDNPFWLYEFIRQYKASYPDKEYHIWLWGEEPWAPEGLAGGYEHARRNAWIAYLAGADAVGWFNWHYEHGWMWDREDASGKKMVLYTNRLNSELEKLPAFKPEPRVLVVRDSLISYQLGLCSELGLFNEWDAVNQRDLARDEFDLSGYQLVVASEDSWLSEAVEKLNGYVEDGGNLILLGGFGWEQTNFYYNGSRTEFLVERGIRQESRWGDIQFTIEEPNPLNLTLSYQHLESTLLGLPRSQLTGSHHPIGEYSYIDGGEAITDVCPLVLYHNESNPGEGSTLYFGVPLSKSYPAPELEDVVETFLDETNYTRYIYRVVTRAYAANYVEMDGSLARLGEENMIITQSSTEGGHVLAGVTNFYEEPRSVTYTLNLNRFDWSPGSYYVYSLSEGQELGLYESDDFDLEVPLYLLPRETCLLLISETRVSPEIAVDTFPNIPADEDVEDFWPVKEIEETEPEPEPEPEPEKEQEVSPEPETETESWEIPAFPIASVIISLILITILYARKSRLQPVGK